MDQKQLKGNLPKILIIEDSPIEQRIYVEYLHQLGCQVQVVSTGREALEKLHRESFDLILSDIGLPGMTGVQVCKRIRRSESGKNSHTPIVAMTAYGDIVEKSCQEAGFDYFIEKPFQIEGLKKILMEMMPSFH